ncbi:MAG TPA: hypothetical protein VFA65_10140 [Bryobacteraceae bacterium]|nr:hypothetical protein [Bryobacteraceae bacterium]
MDNNAVLALIETLKRNKFSDANRIEHILDDARRRSPMLGEIVPVCAIPRKFDAEIIGVLRGFPNEADVNERLLSELQTFNFVVSRPDSGFAYHDSIREMFLCEWRTNERLSEYKQLNAKLSRHFDAQARRISTKVLSEGMPSEAESRKVEAMLEAIYHDILRYPPAGFKRFEDYYRECNAVHAVRVCRTLVHATRDYLERIGEEKAQRHQVERYLLELRYDEGRLAGEALQYQAAENIFRELLNRLVEPSRLKILILGELGWILSKQDRYSEARQFLEQGVDTEEQIGADAWNQGLRLHNLALCYQSLQDLWLSIETYKQAVEAARAEGNAEQEKYAQIGLCHALHVAGRGKESTEAALAALDLVRSSTNDPDLLMALDWQLMTVFSRSSPTLLDTSYREALAMLSNRSGSDVMGLDCHYATALRDSKQLDRAQQLLDSLKTQDEPGLRADICFERGLLTESKGNTDAALEFYRQVARLSAEPAPTWLYAASRYNAGCLLRDAARFDDALIEFNAAGETWRDLGFSSMVALVELGKALLQIRKGQAAETIPGLLRIRDSWQQAGCPYLADCLVALGKAHRNLTEWTKATESMEQAFQLYVAAGDLNSAAEIAGELAATEAARGNWSNASRWSASSQSFWQKLAEVSSYTSSVDVIAADDANGRAVYLLSLLTGDRAQNLVAARTASEQALRLRPDNVLYRLNFCYIAAAQEDWQAAIDELQRVLDSEPEWSDSPTLHRRLGIYRKKILGNPISKNTTTHKRINVEIGTDLRPEDARSKSELQEGIARLRRNIAAEFGFSLPALSLQVSENGLERSRYLISLDGKVLASGKIEDATKTATTAKLVSALDDALRSNLGECLNFQEFQALLRSWQAETDDHLTRELPDRPAKVRFWHLLRQTLSRQQPIYNWRSLLP